jgi:hypothetical protein
MELYLLIKHRDKFIFYSLYPRPLQYEYNAENMLKKEGISVTGLGGL